MHGVIAAGNPHTAEAAAQALRAGGNAVDAAVAGALASFVAEPLLAGAGGAGILTAALPGREPAVVDFFSWTPRATPNPAALDFEAVEVDFGSATQVFHVGRGAVAMPLALPGLAAAAHHFGSLPLGDLAQPAVQLARRGVPLTEETVHVFRLLWPILTKDPRTTQALAPSGLPEPGSTHRNPALAETLEEFAREGDTPERMKRGLIAGFGPDVGGLLTRSDLGHAQARIVEPRRIREGEWEFLTSPRVGGRMVGVILDALARIPAGVDEPAEVARLARASNEGHRARTSGIGPGSTTHLSAVDTNGGIASVTLTNGEGCGHLIDGTGVQANNFLGEEDLSPRGFHQHPPATPLPTMIAPTVAIYRGAPWIGLGSGGSNRIRSSVSQVLYRLVARGEPLAGAVEAPRVHAEGEAVWVELEGLGDPDRVLAALRGSFRHVYSFARRDFFFGGVHAVKRAEDGSVLGAGDGRRGGVVVRV